MRRPSEVRGVTAAASLVTERLVTAGPRRAAAAASSPGSHSASKSATCWCASYPEWWPRIERVHTGGAREHQMPSRNPVANLR
eukprot:scaffold8130_cov69-Phaeocystis_antarctica.AAC.11